MKIAFVVNGSKPKAIREIEKIKKQLSGLAECEFFVTEQPGHAIEISHEICEANLQTQSLEIDREIDEKNLEVQKIIAIGGDGTLNECVNGIMQAKSNLGAGDDFKIPALGIYPMGTGNDFARTIGAKRSLFQLQKMLLSESAIQVDAAIVTSLDSESGLSPKYFINLADVGIGPGVVAATKKRMRFGKAISFTLAISKAILFEKYQSYKIEFNGECVQQKCVMVAVTNGKWLGNGLSVTPQAEIADGQLNLAILGEMNLFDFVWHFASLKLGKQVVNRKARFETSIRVDIHGQGTMGLDGEPCFALPARIEILTGAMKILVPTSKSQL